MAEVWRCYVGLTGFNRVDIYSIVPLAVKAGEAVHTLIVIVTLYRAGWVSLLPACALVQRIAMW